MRILEDGPDGAGAHAFAVELEIDDEGAALRRLWDSAPDRSEYGVPYAMVRCEGGRIGTSALRASLRRFNKPPDDGWRWTVEALAAHLLQELCGVALLGFPFPPNRGLCPHGNAYATDGGVLRWLGVECAPCISGGGPEALGRGQPSA